MTEAINRPETQVDFLVREATFEDGASILSTLHKSTLEAYTECIPEVTPEMLEHRFTTQFGDQTTVAKLYGEDVRYKKDSQLWLVAEQEGSVQGVLEVDQDFEGTGSRVVKMLYVLPEAQGTGMCGNLLLSGLKWLKADINDVSLRVISTNEKAISFYEHFNFFLDRQIPQSELKSTPFPNGYQYQEAEMLRRAAPL